VKHKKGELQEPAIGTLIHSCWIKIQRPDLGQYSIGTVGQYSVGANRLSDDCGIFPAVRDTPMLILPFFDLPESVRLRRHFLFPSIIYPPWYFAAK
jgi:hypothetical protein